MSISLTPEAARHVSAMLAKRGSGMGLRLGTKKSGCTGFAYVVDYADEVGEADSVFESQGIKIVVDPDSLGRLQGTRVDFVRANILNQPRRRTCRRWSWPAPPRRPSARKN